MRRLLLAIVITLAGAFAAPTFRGSHSAFACSYDSHNSKTDILDGGSTLGYVRVWQAISCGTGAGWHTETVSYGGQPTYAELDYNFNGSQNVASQTCNALDCNTSTANPGPDGFSGTGCIWIVGINRYYCASTPLV